ncbi:hypothetical protein AB0K18_39630 [Nonomuraea sp. NPDC049421]|uniref:hypothetical protein n=1 Tax=Nonomuraea sp. NPDC049421 TaxID=3155275 RepID=UPI003419B69E
MRFGPMALAALLAVPALSARPAYDFAAPGVAIRAEPAAGARVHGFGQPGEGFASNREEEHEAYACGPYETTLWHHGHNASTGVIGWVPACDLLDSD